MSRQARVADGLREVVEDNGRRVARAPELVRAMLSDALGEHAREARAEIDALSIAAREGIAGDLLAGPADADNARAGSERLTALGLSDEMATFAIAAWSHALGRTDRPPETGLGASTQAASVAAPTEEFVHHDRPPPGAPTGRRLTPVIAAITLTALVMSVAWLFFGSRDPASSEHDAASPGHGVGSSAKPQAPMVMPSKTPVPAGVAGPPSAPAAGKPTAPSPSGTALTASSSEKTFTPLITSTGPSGCAAEAGTQNLQWCPLTLDVGAGGTTNTWRIVNAYAIEQHGKVEIVGRALRYTPFHNGAYVDHINYQLQDEGKTSDVATITLHANCNENYQCHHEP